MPILRGSRHGVRGGAGVWELPLELRLDRGSLFEAFENVGEWTGSGGTFVDDTTYFVEGAQSVRLTSEGGVAAARDKVIAADLKDMQRVELWLYVHDDPAIIQGIQLYFSSVTDWSKYMVLDLDETLLAQGANRVVALVSEFTESGGESWSNTMIRMRIRVDATLTNNLSVSWDDLRLDPEFQPAIMLVFDDGYDDVYSVALPELVGHNVRGVSYIVSDDVGGAGRMTSAQLGVVNAAGWDVGNHGQTHVNFTTLTQGQIETEIATCNAALVGWGVGDARLHLAYPYGARDADSDAAMAAQSMLSGRLALAGDERQFWIPAVSYWYRLPTVETLDDTVSLAAAQAIVDDIVVNGSVGIFLLHKLEVSAAALTWAIEDFASLVAYIVAAGVPVITVRDLFALRTGAVIIPWSVE